ncbi:hypothetical protein GGQ73_002908 [Rhizobium skierniewicense]|uniref:Uncharacterized protein n=1 Tax=Rhizobium skierniewicense TaxID=984260 RepID=A0A7W6C9K0_9HYPH|nr:hypothetical protein [Rhizobium skierniewicense]MBB3946944.1 hypothetical protein [Rhizobium skierniewicense]NTF32156.1 hypothetical protein [Rhizobium skierniewicense]
MNAKLISIVALAAGLAASPALADESQFLSSLKGSWKGSGTVTMKIGSKPINVTCTFDSTASGPTLRMNGTCRGLLVVRRAISADLRASGTRYRGNYVGPSGIPSALSGSRSGNSVNLSVAWKRVINGDRVAAMTITKVGNNGLRLRTTDRDGAGGPTVVTADIQLTR